MDELEKVEKLRNRANVTYEEAKKALDENNGDLLEAMIALEKQGKTKAPEQENYSTAYEEQKEFVSVAETVNQKKYDDSENFGSKFKRFCKLVWKKGKENFFVVERKGEMIIKIPVWVLVILLLLVWQILIPLMIISLFFECRYSFRGEDDLSSVNSAMEKAGEVASEMAERAKDEFHKL